MGNQYMMTVVKLTEEANTALEQEVRRRIQSSGQLRVTKKDVASELILAALDEQILQNKEVAV